MPSIDIKVAVGGGIALVLVGVSLALLGNTGIWAGFCILLGISVILFGVGQKPTFYLGLCFLAASLIFLGRGLVPLLA